MKIEKIDRVFIDVKTLDEAVTFFSNLFGTKFERMQRKPIVTEYAGRSPEESRRAIAISPIGLELIQWIPPLEKEGLRGYCFKVSSLEQAMAEMKAKGIRILREIAVGGLKEAIFNPDDLYGAQLALAEYETDTVVSAILQR